MMKLKALFITRNYPPMIGGLEMYSYNLIREFETHGSTYKIVHSRSKIHLIWFLPCCLFRAFYIAWKRDITHIHLCDGFLGLLGVCLKLLTKARISITIHGLDITYRNSFYQLIIPWSVAQLDKVICVSRSTQDECIKRKVPMRKCVIIPNGIKVNELYLPKPRPVLRLELEQVVRASLGNKTVLLSLGRLITRKGIAWFIENVMPYLDTSYYYLIVGDGPEYENVQDTIKRNNLQDRISMLGKVSNEERTVIYNASDIFIMPNINVPGDVEGFGIVAIEAGSCGLPVVASNIQGIRDAVIDGETGYLIKEYDTGGFIKKIKYMNLKREKVRSIVNSTFDWAQIYKHYHDVLMKL